MILLDRLDCGENNDGQIMGLITEDIIAISGAGKVTIPPPLSCYYLVYDWSIDYCCIGEKITIRNLPDVFKA